LEVRKMVWFESVQQYFDNTLGFPFGLAVALLLFGIVFVISSIRNSIVKKKSLAAKASEEKYPQPRNEDYFDMPEIHTKKGLDELERLYTEAQYLGNKQQNNLLAKKGELEEELRKLSEKYQKSKKMMHQFQTEFLKVRSEYDSIRKQLEVIK